MGYLGDFPEPVWYDFKGVANILSLFIVQKYYQVLYDSRKDNSFIVSMPNKTKFCFHPTVKGLYAYNKKPGEDPQEWAFITIVKGKKDLYMRCEYEAAVCAHWVQNIIMYPGVCEYMDIVDKNIIQNLPVTHDDI
jgi:hypothetical protein